MDQNNFLLEIVNEDNHESVYDKLMDRYESNSENNIFLDMFNYLEQHGDPNDIASKIDDFMMDDFNELNIGVLTENQLSKLIKNFSCIGDCIYHDQIELMKTLSFEMKKEIFWGVAENRGYGPQLLLHMARLDMFSEMYRLSKHNKYNKNGKWQFWEAIKKEDDGVNIYNKIFEAFEYKELNDIQGFFLYRVLYDLHQYGEDVTKYFKHFKYWKDYEKSGIKNIVNYFTEDFKLNDDQVEELKKYVK